MDISRYINVIYAVVVWAAGSPGFLWGRVVWQKHLS